MTTNRAQLLVGGLGWETPLDAFKPLFQRIGEVIAITKASLPHLWVIEMGSPDQAKTAMSTLQGTLINGTPLAIRSAHFKRCK